MIDPWCNWQHVWFWSRRVQVRALTGQPKLKGVHFYFCTLFLFSKKNFKGEKVDIQIPFVFFLIILAKR